ncbi:MAG: hypothetical protein HYZ83_06425 [Candidatus Omnitrophica bacterium]|nr:hypothetical protein [Candidatus Omnitrophota bacterium]
MKIFRAFLFFFSFLFLFSESHGILGAEPEASITVKAELSRAFITIGDPVEYTVVIRHDPTIEVLSNVPPPADEVLKIQKVEDIKRKEGKRIIEGRRFRLTAFSLGDFILEPVEIQYRDKKAGGEIKKLETNRLFLSVQSVDGAKEKYDIRGIKSVLAMAERWMGLLIALVVIVILVLAGILYRRLSKKAAFEVPAESLLTPDQEALLHLSELFDSDLLRRGKTKEYFLKLSEILRIYFEKRYGVPAIESTTYEVLRLLKDKETPQALREKIDEVLSSADLAKFAKWKPEPVEIISINKKSKQIVEDSRPPITTAVEDTKSSA